MKNYFSAKHISQDFLLVVGMFVCWRFALVIFLMAAVNFIPLGYTDRFLGGGPGNYFLSPWIFSWANFDGEHYLSIALFGYKFLEQAFFPVYPTLISIIAKPFSEGLFSSLLFSTFTGLIISNFSFFLSLVILWNLVRIDFPKKIAFWTIMTILIFPTSFYFGAVYSESIFLLLTLISFYFARKQRWALAGVVGTIAAATRIFGIFLLPALLLEIWQQKVSLKKSFWILLIPLGLFSYMGYQWVQVGDPLAFYRLQKLVGEQHQSGLTVIFQVYYRYIKMLLTTSISNPIYPTLVLEFATGIFFLFLPIYGYFKKIRYSYLFYALIGFLTPTIQGSFSSVPRYVIVFFPSFLAFAILINNSSRLIKISLVILLSCWLAFATMFFLRGYWVS